jgi:periplasmic divalent cation tolerance protein
MTHKLVLTTCPDIPSAHTLAEGLIELNLAACVNLLPAVVSIYKWQDKVEQNQEVQLFIKTAERKVTELISYIENHHSYDVPECIVVDITSGSERYLKWLDIKSN